MEEDDTPRNYLYETLTPLSVSSPTSTTSVSCTESPPPPSSPENSEPYSVYRNEISLSEIQTELFDRSAQDFFSLDVGEDNVEPEPVVAVTEEAEPKTPLNESHTGLESVLFRGNGRFKSPMLQLHKEIVDFCDFLSPTSEEQASRNAAVLSVFGVIRYIWPNCKVEVFGSFRTGLYLPTSDIDVVILESGIKTPQLGLQALSRALSQKGIAKKIQVIGKARVPIIKFVERRSGVAFDVSFDVENGPKAADFIKDAILNWPPLRPLCLILKVFLQQRELNEVYSGGIGSYALLTMLMAMLRNVQDSRTSPENNLGVLLVEFFDIYGRKLNTSNVGVSCRGEGTFFLKSSKGFLNQGRPSLLAIEDPQTPDNDIGKNSFNYFQIKSAFAMAYSTLTNPKIIAALGPNRSILGTIIRPDAVLLERKGGHNGNVTFKSLLPGAGDPLEPNYGDQQEIFCNWQMDDEEEPLPRGSGILGALGEPSLGKKRKSGSKAKSAKNKGKEIKGTDTPAIVENGTKSVSKKQRKRGQYNASPLNWR